MLAVVSTPVGRLIDSTYPSLLSVDPALLFLAAFRYVRTCRTTFYPCRRLCVEHKSPCSPWATVKPVGGKPNLTGGVVSNTRRHNEPPHQNHAMIYFPF